MTDDHGWRPAARSEIARRMYEQAESEMAAKPGSERLDLGRLIESARRAMGLSDFGGDDFMPGMERLVESMNEEGGLNAVGVKAGAGMVRAPLATRLKLVELERARPEIFQAEIVRPIFIVGGSRTGTTLLQRLLAVAPKSRALLAWEMTSPAVLGETNQEAITRARNVASISHQGLHLLNPTMKSVHFSGADLPEECVLMMGASGMNWGILPNISVPSYARWLAGQDFTREYQRHRSFLQVLQADQPGRQWVLKAPYHLPELEAILNVYPDAVIIHTHRDMVETVASSASLFCTLRNTFSDQVDPVAAGVEQMELLGDWLGRAREARRSLPADSPARFIDVRFKELVADPMAMARRIYERLGQEFTDETVRLMEAHLAENRAHEHGRHRYSAEEFGLEVEAVRERFGGYSAAYL